MFRRIDEVTGHHHGIMKQKLGIRKMNVSQHCFDLEAGILAVPRPSSEDVLRRLIYDSLIF